MKSEKVDTSGGIEQIRQLLFGEQVDSIIEELNRLKAELENLNKKSTQDIKELQNAISKENELSATNHTTLKEQVSALAARLDDSVSQFNNKLERMNNQKVDISLIGDMFVEFGENLKSTNK